MNKAVWKEKTLIADEVAREYEYEKQVRRASREGDLLCIDTNCKNNIMKYCHGEKRGAYFAHRSSDYLCSYGEFDKENTYEMREISHKLKAAFEAQAANVEIEKKVFDRHYAHLIVKHNKNCTAIELVDSKFSVKQSSYLIEKYKPLMNVAWIVIDDVEKQVFEHETNFVKRFLLNEGNEKNLVIVDYDCNRVSQYRCDFNDYTLADGSRCFPRKELFVLQGFIEQLTITDKGITLANFKVDYNDWIKNRTIIFKKKKEKIRQDEVRKIEKENKLRDKHRKYQEKRQQIMQEKTIEEKGKHTEKDKRKKEEEDRPNPEDRIKIRELLKQQKTQVIDSQGNRWFKCRYCGRDGKEGAFISYGGNGEKNLGCCRNNACKTIHEEKQSIKPKNKELKKEVPQKYWHNLCDICGEKLVIRRGRHGEFLGCSNYPKCRYTRNI